MLKTLSDCHSEKIAYTQHTDRELKINSDTQGSRLWSAYCKDSDFGMGNLYEACNMWYQVAPAHTAQCWYVMTIHIILCIPVQ